MFFSCAPVSAQTVSGTHHAEGIPLVLDESFNMDDNLFAVGGVGPIFRSQPYVLGMEELEDERIVVWGKQVREDGLIQWVRVVDRNGAPEPGFELERELVALHGVKPMAGGKMAVLGEAEGNGDAVLVADSTGSVLWEHSIPVQWRPFRGGVLALGEGRLLVYGAFTNVGGFERSGLAVITEAGSVDEQFAPEMDGIVKTAAVQEDGSIIIGGDFAEINGVTRRNVARLTSAGEVDVRFNPGEIIPLGVEKVTVQGNGQVLVGGYFRQMHGAPRDYLLRLNSDGSWESGFGSAPGTDGEVLAIAVDAENRIVVGGNFTQVHGVPRNRMARLLADGSVDAEFNPGKGPNWHVMDIEVDGNGDYLIAGTFSQISNRQRWGAARVFSDTDRSGVGFDRDIFLGGEQYGAAILHLVRFGNPSGELLATITTEALSAGAEDFNSGPMEVRFGPGETNKVVEIGVVNDGFVEGPEQFEVRAAANLPGSPESVARFEIEDDERPVVVEGRVLPEWWGGARLTAVWGERTVLAGEFYRRFPWLHEPVNILMVDTEGELDPTFQPVTVTNFAIQALAVDPSGRITVGGEYNTVSWEHRPALLRFLEDGTPDTTFWEGGFEGVTQLTALPDGKLLVAGVIGTWPHTRPAFMRLHPNGTADPGFEAPSELGEVISFAVGEDGRILTASRGMGVVRLQEDGKLDESFRRISRQMTQYPSRVRVYTTGGEIYVAGKFNEVHGVVRPGLVRLTEEGEVDLGFNPALRQRDEYEVLPGSESGRVIVAWGEDLVVLKGDGSVGSDTFVPDPFVHYFSGFGVRREGHLGLLGRLPEPNAGIGWIPLTNIHLSQVRFERTKLLLGEGQAAEVRVRRVGDVSRALELELRIEGAAEAVQVSPMRIHFAPLQKEAVITILGRADELVERDEEIRLWWEPTESTDNMAAPGILEVGVFDANGRPGARDMNVEAVVEFYPSIAKVAGGGEVAAVVGERMVVVMDPQTGETNELAFPETHQEVGYLTALAVAEEEILAAGIFNLPESTGESRYLGALVRWRREGRGYEARGSPGFLVDPHTIAAFGGNYFVGGSARNNPEGRLENIVHLDGDLGIERMLRAAGTPVESIVPITESNLVWLATNCVARLDVGPIQGEAFEKVISDGEIRELVRDADSLLIGGDFSAVNGKSRGGIARLTLTGEVVGDFAPVITPPSIQGIYVDGEGRIMISGSFWSVNGVRRLGVARLNSDGSLDEGFDVGPEPYVIRLAGIRPDGHLVVLGFPEWAQQGEARYFLVHGELPFEGGASAEAGVPVIRFQTEPGRIYHFEGSVDLLDWSTVLRTNASGYQVELPIIGVGTQFFRGARE